MDSRSRRDKACRVAGLVKALKRGKMINLQKKIQKIRPICRNLYIVISVKKISWLALVLALLGTGFFLFKKDKLRVNRSSAQQTKGLKNRNLVTGQPQFIEQDKKFPKLQEHIKRQWALKDIEFLKAWEILDKEKKSKKPVVVAVVDTGIDTSHPCLKNNLWKNPKEIPNNKKDDDNNGFVDDVHGWNFVDNNNNIKDYHGHGTHVSGIIAARGATPQTPNCKVVGVAPYVKIMTLKYFDEKGSSDNNIKNTVKSIKYAVKNGADIINYSGGGPGANSDEKNIIAKAADKNIIFVAALGNEGMEIGRKEKYYPASYNFPNILFVLSKNKEEIIKSSNRVKLDTLENKLTQNAPGENIISTLPPRTYLHGHLSFKTFRNIASLKKRGPQGNYGYMTGTSQATAVVSGVVALV